MNETKLHLSAELEAAVVRALLSEWHHVNDVYFNRSLVTPQLMLTSVEAFLGRWVRSARCIEMSRRLVAEQPWGVVIEVLGAPDAEGVDMLAVLRQYQLALHFPMRVLAEAQAGGRDDKLV